MTAVTSEAAGRLERLKAILRSDVWAIAFSGGLDSRFLAHMALQTARSEGLTPPVLLHVCGPHTANAERVRAEAWAAEAGAAMVMVPLNPLNVPEVRRNTRERCYHCKHALFSELLHRCRDRTLADGSNASDTEGYRPGLRALRELGVRSPLMEAGLAKADIHALAAHTGLSEPWQKPRPCLLTRFPYDTEIQESRLRELEIMEEAVADVIGSGPDAPDYRLRADTSGLCLYVEGSTLPDALRAALRTRFPLLRVETTARVSGHFDGKICS